MSSAKLLLVKVVEGNNRDLVQTVDQEGAIIIGRGIQSQMVLSLDNRVSRSHCKIFGEKGRFYIEDLGSSNGTYIGDRRVTGRTPLKAGDRFLIGSSILEVSYISKEKAQKIALARRTKTVPRQERALDETQPLAVISDEELGSGPPPPRAIELEELDDELELEEIKTSSPEADARATQVTYYRGLETKIFHVPHEEVIAGDQQQFVRFKDIQQEYARKERENLQKRHKARRHSQASKPSGEAKHSSQSGDGTTLQSNGAAAVEEPAPVDPRKQTIRIDPQEQRAFFERTVLPSLAEEVTPITIEPQEEEEPAAASSAISPDQLSSDATTPQASQTAAAQSSHVGISPSVSAGTTAQGGLAHLVPPTQNGSPDSSAAVRSSSSVSPSSSQAADEQTLLPTQVPVTTEAPSDQAATRQPATLLKIPGEIAVIGKILKDAYLIETFLEGDEHIHLYQGQDVRNQQNLWILVGDHRYTFLELNHPCLAPLLEQFEEDGLAFQVFICPGSLLSQQTFRPVQAITISLALADTLLFLHRRGQCGLQLSAQRICLSPLGLPLLMPSLRPDELQEHTVRERMAADRRHFGELLWGLLTRSSSAAFPSTNVDNNWREKLVNLSLPEGLRPLLENLLETERTPRELDMQLVVQSLQEILVPTLTPEMHQSTILPMEIRRHGNILIWSVPGHPPLIVPWDQRLAHEIINKHGAVKNIEEIRLLGRHLYEQFFPPQWRHMIRQQALATLSIKCDAQLQIMPWEIAYDGQGFWAQDFSFSRTGTEVRSAQLQLKKVINLLCIASEARYAQQCQLMAQKLTSAIAGIKIVVWAGGALTALLERITKADLIHIIGQAQVHADRSASGWSLPGHKRLTVAHFQNFSHSPAMVFSQVELAPREATLLAWQVVQTGVPYSLALWRPSPKLELVVEFYRQLLAGSPVDQALQLARRSMAAQSLESMATILFGLPGRVLVTQ